MVDHRERVHISFINNRTCVIVDFIVGLYSLRYTYVFKINVHVCTYFKQGIWADQIRNAYFPRNGNFKTTGIYF